jgi:hypothetical protein
MMHDVLGNLFAIHVDYVVYRDMLGPTARRNPASMKRVPDPVPDIAPPPIMIVAVFAHSRVLISLSGGKSVIAKPFCHVRVDSR